MPRNYAILDVVNTTDEFGARTFALIAVTETGYRAVSLKDRKRYNLTDEQIAVKVGTISEDSPLLLEDEYDDEVGKRYCVQQAREFPQEAFKWTALAKLSSGDKIQVVHRKTLFPDAIFVGINLKKPLYPIRAKIKGLSFDFRIDAFIC